MILKEEKKNIIFIIFLFIFLMIYLYIYTFIPKEEIKLRDKIIQYSTKTSIDVIKKVILFILEDNNASLSYLFKDKTIRRKITKVLNTFRTGKIKYIFIIYKDKNKYRYLIDTESSVDSYKTLFIPFENELKTLKYIEKTQKEIYTINSQLKTLGITYYIPLRDKNTLKAILVIDFSFETLEEINIIVNNVKQAILILMLFTFILIIISIFMVIRLFFIRRKIFEDSLTKVYNRKYLGEIENSIDLKDYIVAIVDIDFFKHINDTYGHKVGDEILKQFAQLLKKNLRQEDIIIRYGGEEFLILLKKDRNFNNKKAFAILERLMNAIRSINFNNLKITASFGVNLDTDKARNLSDAIKKADLALYKAKREGRDKIEIYTEKKDEEISISELKDIIEKDQFTFYFQPVVNLKTKKVLYYESLLRFKFQNSIVPPFKYLEMIKGTFLYSKLSKKIIEKNIEILKENPQLKTSINLSPVDLINDATVLILLKEGKNIIERLKIEIIETEDIKDYEKLKINVSKLKSIGYEIALDDFGKGYINFFYLTEIPADYIKIDGSIIRNIHKTKEHYVLCKHIANFAKEMNIKVVAEFVENEEIVQKLLEIGIEYGQGYYFHNPRPLTEIIQD
ncbi:MAG TPA: bifunctional diguanylate cyclase/phosphodiesterase [Hydrogenothermaceae bacterium]|nr:bifunctional diguanylate cyclase/phosphodiesterase [Hydrogenothermaceae bacterium]